MKSDASFLEYLSLIIKIEHVQWKSQIDFIIDNNGDQLVDDCFKLEEIEQNYEKLSSKIGVNFHKLSHDNKGNYSSYKDYMTSNQILNMYQVLLLYALHSLYVEILFYSLVGTLGKNCLLI